MREAEREREREREMYIDAFVLQVSLSHILSRNSLPIELKRVLLTHTYTHALFSPPVLLCIDVYIQDLALERLAVAGWGVWQFGHSQSGYSD